jgi:hypothetical protein
MGGQAQRQATSASRIETDTTPSRQPKPPEVRKKIGMVFTNIFTIQDHLAKTYYLLRHFAKFQDYGERRTLF